MPDVLNGSHVLDSINCEAIDEQSPPTNFQDYLTSYYQPLVPCQNCAAKQLDCKVFVNDGNRQCFACISLFRTCSFVQPQSSSAGTAGRIDTLHSVNEDAVQELGLPTGIRSSYTAGASRSGFQNGDTQTKKRSDTSGRFSKEVLHVLRSWMYSHTEHPYPTEEEKDDLKDRTGLTRSQLTNWLANARRRGQVRPTRSILTSTDSLAQPVAINQAPGRCLSSEKSLMTPFERWKDSPPENEAPISILAREAENTQFPQEWHSASAAHSVEQHRSSGGSALSRLRAPSQTSLETGSVSVSTRSQSAWSHGSSHGSYGSFAKKHRRRRQKSVITQSSTKTSARKSSKHRPFQCTFCVDTFSTKYDWTRHEKSVHLNLEKWICAPNGALDHCSNRNTTVCSYCRITNATPEHVEGHNHTVCASKDVMKRTFLRKDHLRQHLRLIHGIDMCPIMDNWRSIPSVVRSRCGFCNANFDNWDERASHLAHHFHTGATMADWKEGWGFDPDVARCVSNAMPPWMIHQKRSQPSPRPMSEFDNTSNAMQETSAPASNAQGWENLTALLAEYVQQCKEEGRVVTDTDLRDYARKYLSDSNDEAESTRADDAEYFSIFKKQHVLHPDSTRDTVLDQNQVTLMTQASAINQPASSMVISGSSQQDQACARDDAFQDFQVDMDMFDLEATTMNAPKFNLSDMAET